MSKKVLMQKAWEIAKNGAKKFGGKIIEYIAEAMKLAWAWMKRIEISVPSDTFRKGRRTWVAQIVGRHPQYVFDRKFMDPDEMNEYGTKSFYVTEGIFEAYDGKRRRIWFVKAGNCREISRNDALYLIG